MLMREDIEYNVLKSDFLNDLRFHTDYNLPFRVNVILSLLEDDAEILDRVRFVDDASMFKRALYIEYDENRPDDMKICYHHEGRDFEDFADFFSDLRRRNKEKIFFEMRLNGDSGAELYGDLIQADISDGDLSDHLNSIAEVRGGTGNSEISEELKQELKSLMLKVEKENILKLIDRSLDANSEKDFILLAKELSVLESQIMKEDDFYVELF